MDLYLDWNSDLLLTPSGSVQTAVGWDQIRQRVIRRVITNSAQQLPDGTQTQADDVFATDFGLGMGKMVDQDFDDEFLAELERRITLGVLEDSDVDTSIPPSIVFLQPNPSTLRISVTVTLLTGQQGQIALEVTP